MPVKLIHESETATDDTLLTQEGDLTLEAQVINDFLTDADFSAVFEHPEAKAHILSIDENGTITTPEGSDLSALRAVLEADAELDVPGDFMSGSVAADLIDESDLVQMLAHYVDAQPEPTTLEEKARMAALANLFGLDEKFARGSFRKMAAKGKVGHAKVARMMLAMLNKGTIKRAKKSTGGYMSGGYEKGQAYKGNVKAGAKNKIARYKKANMAKQKKAARMAKTKMKESSDVFDAPLYGFGDVVEGSVFEVAVRESAAPKTQVKESSETAPTSRLCEGAGLAAAIAGKQAK